MWIVGIVGLAGVVVFGVLFAISVLKGGSLKIPAIGMVVCFALVVAIGAMSFLKIGPFGDPAADSSADPTGTVLESEPAQSAGESAPPDGSEGASTEPVAESDGPTEQPSPEPTQEPNNDSYTVGDSISLDDVVVTLVDVVESNGKDFSTPSDGNVFVICEFTIENNSEDDIAVSSIMSFDAYVDDYATSMSMSAMLSSDKPQLDGSIASGKKMNGVIGYEVGSEWENIEIRFIADFWSGNEFIFTYSK